HLSRTDDELEAQTSSRSCAPSPCRGPHNRDASDCPVPRRFCNARFGATIWNGFLRAVGRNLRIDTRWRRLNIGRRCGMFWRCQRPELWHHATIIPARSEDESDTLDSEAESSCMPACIEGRNVNLTFRPPNRRPVRALHGFDIDVEECEFLSIVGPS